MSLLKVIIGNSGIAKVIKATSTALSGLGIVLQNYAVKGQVLSWGGAETFDLTQGNAAAITLTANVTSVAVSGWPTTGRDGRLFLYIEQGATPYTLAGWPAGIKWLGGLPPLLSTTDGDVDLICLSTLTAGSVIYGSHMGPLI